MWDVLFMLLTFACFFSAVLYVRACSWLKKEQSNG
jgi:hypothetical protein